MLAIPAPGPDADRDAHADADPGPNADRDAHADADRHADVGAVTHTHAGRHCQPNRDAAHGYPRRHCQPDGSAAHGHAHRNPDRQPNGASAYRDPTSAHANCYAAGAYCNRDAGAPLTDGHSPCCGGLPRGTGRLCR